MQLKPQFTLKRQELSIPNVSQKYILSGWLKTDADFETDEGKVEAKLQFYQGNTPVGNPIVVEIEGTNSKWAYTSDGYEGSGISTGILPKTALTTAIWVILPEIMTTSISTITWGGYRLLKIAKMKRQV